MNGQDWAIFNCSPDIREQIATNAVLQPREGLRHSPIKAIVLTNADVDHIAGLLSLREQQAFTVWASAKVLQQINANPIFKALSKISFETLEVGKTLEPLEGLSVTAFDVPGKVPLYREAELGHQVARNGDTLGLHIDIRGKRASYVPGCGDIDARLESDLLGSNAVLFDGTLWTDDEMITSGTGEKTGRRMGHVPVSGAGGTMAKLAALPATQRHFIHMNNTNPLLIDGSPERREAEKKGWRVSDDGMEILL